MALLESVGDNLYVFWPDGHPLVHQRRNQSPIALAEELFQLGLDAEGVWKYDVALQCYQEAVKLNPNATGCWVNAGTIFYRERDFIESEKCYRKALEVDPMYALAHFNLGNLYDEQGKSSLAIRCYEAAIKLNSQYADAHFNLALAHGQRGEKFKAIKHFRAVVQWDPMAFYVEIAEREIRKLRLELGMDERVVSLSVAIEAAPVSGFAKEVE